MVIPRNPNVKSRAFWETMLLKLWPSSIEMLSKYREELKLQELKQFELYLERVDKLTEDVLSIETVEFLKQPIDYFTKQLNEFLYVESTGFEAIRAESISFEVDDVFGKYSVLLGVKLPKKHRDLLISELKQRLGAQANFHLLFNQQDGLWDLNFYVNDVAGFHEKLTIGEAFELVYSFLFDVVATVQQQESMK